MLEKLQHTEFLRKVFLQFPDVQFIVFFSRRSSGRAALKRGPWAFRKKGVNRGKKSRNTLRLGKCQWLQLGLSTSVLPPTIRQWPWRMDGWMDETEFLCYLCLGQSPNALRNTQLLNVPSHTIPPLLIFN